MAANTSNWNNGASASKASSSKKSKKWSWSPQMIDALISALQEYKNMSEFNSIDFNADKVRLYEEVRKILAKSYQEDFGPQQACEPEKPVKEITKDEYDQYKAGHDLDLKQIKVGYLRIKEKIKSIRQDYSKAITSGRRSDSGKIVLEYFDKLAIIWSGSPSTDFLSFGVDTQSINYSGKEQSGNK